MMSKDESVNRNAIAKEIHDALPHLSKPEIISIVEDIVTCFAEQFADGEEIKISGFGKFSVADKAPRKGRNPQTGEELIIPGRKVVRFKVSPILRDSLNTVASLTTSDENE